MLYLFIVRDNLKYFRYLGIWNFINLPNRLNTFRSEAPLKACLSFTNSHTHWLAHLLAFSSLPQNIQSNFLCVAKNYSIINLSTFVFVGSSLSLFVNYFSSMDSLSLLNIYKYSLWVDRQLALTQDAMNCNRNLNNTIKLRLLEIIFFFSQTVREFFSSVNFK